MIITKNRCMLWMILFCVSLLGPLSPTANAQDPTPSDGAYYPRTYGIVGHCRAYVTSSGLTGPSSNLPYQTWNVYESILNPPIAAGAYLTAMVQSSNNTACNQGSFTTVSGGEQPVFGGGTRVFFKAQLFVRNSNCDVVEGDSWLDYVCQSAGGEGCTSGGSTNPEFDGGSNVCEPSPLTMSFDPKWPLEKSLTSVEDGVFSPLWPGTSTNHGWTVEGAPVAILVMTKNDQNYTVPDATMMIGNMSPQDAVLAPRKSEPKNAFRSLRFFDKVSGNGDGVLDANDAFFRRLRFWFDWDHNGISNSRELQTMQQVGVAAFHTDYHWTGRKINGNALLFESTVVMTDGRILPVWDVFFEEKLK